MTTERQDDCVYVLFEPVGFTNWSIGSIVGIYESEELAAAADAKLPPATTDRTIVKQPLERAPTLAPYYVVIDRWGNVFMACGDAQEPAPADVGEVYRDGAWHEVVYGTVEAYSVEDAIAAMHKTRETLLMSGGWWVMLARYRQSAA